MKYIFNITDDKFSEAKRIIIANGGEISGNSFEISGVKGDFKQSDGKIEINITDKPWLASWGMIESKLNEFFK